MEADGYSHNPAALPPVKETCYLFYGRLGGPQARSGRVRKIRLHRVFFLYSRVLFLYLFLCLDCPAFCRLSLSWRTIQTSMPPAGFETATPASGSAALSYSPGLDPRTAQSVASRYIDWGIAAHITYSTCQNVRRFATSHWSKVKAVPLQAWTGPWEIR